MVFPVARSVLGATFLSVIGASTPFLLATQAVLIRADLQFSAQGLGIAVSTAFASAALFTFCCGPVFRQLSFRAGIGISGAIVAAGSFGTVYWVNSFESLLVSMVVLGSANACCQVTANSVIATAVPAHRRGLGFGIKQGSVPAAIMISGLAVPTLTILFGWRSTFAVQGAVGIALITVAVLMPRVPRSVARGEVSHRLVAVAPLALCALATLLGSAAANFLGAYLASWAHVVDLSVESAGVLIAIGSTCSVFGRIFLGLIADRKRSGHLLIVASQMIMGALCLALIGLLPQPGVVATFGALAFLVGWSWPGLMLFAVAKLVKEAPVTAILVIQASAFAGGALGPFVFGALVGWVGYKTAWVAAAGAFTVAGLLILLAIRRFK